VQLVGLSAVGTADTPTYTVEVSAHIDRQVTAAHTDRVS
jgi:hypothetical protein